MSDIILLDSATIDKIAAGEVIERPVNVVKELLENSIDGGADIINVEIKNGGQDLIRVTDNGFGIVKDQVKSAFLRHATSKLTDIKDLESLHSLGFRGEALSSISAVSKAEMITKTKDSLLGTHITIDGGKLSSFEEIGAPNGTTVIVRQLFYNTPARKKFLKSATAEAARIEDLIEKIALSHPEISFTFIINGKTRFTTSGNGDLKDVIYRIRGREIYDRLLSIDHDDKDLKITGFITRPEYNAGTREEEVFFVNKRLVTSKDLSLALEDGFHGYLMQHRFPFGIVFIDIDPSSIDVNVHPQKSEIRFDDIFRVRDAIVDCVAKKLHEPELIPVVDVEDESKKVIETEITTEHTNENAFTLQEDKEPGHHITEESISVEPVMPDVTKRPDPVEHSPEPFQTKRIVNREFEEIPSEPSIPEYRQDNMFEEMLIDDAPLKEYRIIGQVFDTYWLITLNDNLYIVDQHAAHEKLNYERFLKAFEDKDGAYTQYINPPMVMHLTRQEEMSLKENMDTFTKVGFEIDDFGDKSYAIRGVPIELYGNTPEEMFKRLLYELYEHEKINNPKVVLEKLASMSCKAAIKGGMKISYEEMSLLMKQLMSLDNPYHCPHGRPVFILITKNELEKKFKRIV